MTPETWFVLTVAAAFLLLGVAGSPLAWVALHHRRSRLEALVEQGWKEQADRIDKLENRLAELEAAGPARTREQEAAAAGASPRGRFLPYRHGNGAGRRLTEASATDVDLDQALIAVPNLALTPPNDRDAAVSGLTQRYAAIWTLADQGASPEVIARATGQPVGQIELILGLRRQIDGTRTAIPHAPHV
jgi:hypothetical protein